MSGKVSPPRTRGARLIEKQVMTEGYGHHAAEYFGLPPAPALRSSILDTPDVTITRIVAEAGAVNLTDPIPSENAFVLCLQFQDVATHELWFDGKPESVPAYRRGDISVVDLAARPTAFLPTAFDTLQFYLPESSLRRIADAEDSPVIRELAIPHGTQDTVVQSIGALLLPALATPDTPRLFVDGLMLALHSHLAQTYGQVRLVDARKTGGLAPWQEQLAKAMINEALEGGLSIFDLATACDVSPAYFCRAFKTSTGTTPHRWLTQRRIEAAKALLTHTTQSLSHIALACGFTDHSHFNRVFFRATGSAPGSWRKSIKGQTG
ncbi:helix-turn-helix domain-containing protein [Paraburkholderia bryophila]|uniref:AraC-like DNA-binding protein n=1 Tax=Paraburkholderia bryophila TaxID=420952 RepID=A0A7Z0B1D3_9BURK|nr:AraC family transcriptional regulator [Paraburkholderia bryophila]NYH16758.1 AraC-like DNA-binding protein [Paraburkholderia bryophila]